MIPENLFSSSLNSQLPDFFSLAGTEDSISFTDFSSVKGSIAIIAGRDVIRQNSVTNLAALAGKLNCPVVSTLDGKSAFDNFSPLYSGSIGIMGNPSAIEAVKNADSLIIAGAKLNETDLYGLSEIIQKKKLLILGEKPLFPVDSKVVSSSIASGCRLLSDNLKRTGRYVPHEITTVCNADNIYVRMMKIIENNLPDTGNLSIDAGVCGSYALHTLKVKSTNCMHIALGIAGMGFSFGSVIGSVRGNGEKGFLIAGDGSFYMNGFEIHTALEMKLPIIFIIFNNNGHQLCSVREKIAFQEQSGINEFSPVNIGRGFDALFSGLHAYDVESESELEAVFHKVTNINTPVLISINISTEEFPPFLPFIKESK